MDDLTPDRRELGKKLKRYRIERELTFERLAAIVRIHPSALWKIENGQTIPTEITAHKIVKALPGILGDAA